MSMTQFANTNIGIIGAGHLGRSLAISLIKKGIKPSHLLLSCSGSPSTLEHIKKANLTDSLTNNQSITKHCDIIFLCVRPQEFSSINNLRFNTNQLVISCMAGVEISSIKKLGISTVVRILPSGPETILKGVGVAGMYPENQLVRGLLGTLNFTIFPLQNEDEFHYFAGAVCLPAVLIKIFSENRQEEMTWAIDYFSQTHAWFTDIYKWATGHQPNLDNEESRRNYIAGLATKGGITEAIINSLERKETIKQALMAGIKRSQELSEIVNKPAVLF